MGTCTTNGHTNRKRVSFWHVTKSTSRSTFLRSISLVQPEVNLRCEKLSISKLKLFTYLIFLFQFLFQALSRSPCWQSTPDISAQKLLSYGLKSKAPTVKKYLKEGVLFQQFLQKIGYLGHYPPRRSMFLRICVSCSIKDEQALSLLLIYAALKWIPGLLPIAFNPLDSGLCKKLVDAERRQRPTYACFQGNTNVARINTADYKSVC